MLEIERKFLLKEIPDLKYFSSFEIEQSYLSFSPEIRIRKKEDRYFITRKGDGTQIREEIEFGIDKMTYEILLSLITGRTITKTRFNIPIYDEVVAELDIYHGELEGLYTIETEFQNEEQANHFVPPEWFGCEVTNDKRYKNKNLARCNDIESFIHVKPISHKKEVL